MSNKTVVYNRKKYKTADIVNFHNEGYDVLCSVCKAKLIFILSLEEAKIKDPGHPGIFCPNSSDHVYTTFNMGSREFWQRFEERVKERTKSNIIEMRRQGFDKQQIKKQILKDYPDTDFESVWQTT